MTVWKAVKVSVDEAAVTVAKAVDVDVVKKVDGADVTVATGLICRETFGMSVHV